MTTNRPANIPSNLPEQVLPIGANALLNTFNKSALICGQYKTPAKAWTTLPVLNKPTMEELLSELESRGYQPTYPKKKVPPATGETPPAG